MNKNLSFKQLLYRFSTVALSASLLLIAACSSDDDPQVVDTTKPVVSFKDLPANSTLAGTVTLEGSASDDQGITKVEFFVDNVSIGTINTTPYKVEWNTTTVPDGTHTLKVIATDGAGNQQTVEISITVKNKNVIISIDVPADFLSEGDYNVSKAWVVVHDHDWNVVASTPIENGKKAEIIAPATFDDESFTLTELFVLTEEGNPYVRALSFLEVTKGTWVLSKERDEVAGSAVNLSFKNPKGEGIGYWVATNGGLAGYNSVTTADEFTFEERSVDFTGTTTKLYMAQYDYNDGDMKYVFTGTPAIANGGSYQIDLNAVNNASNFLFKDVLNRPEEAHEDYGYVKLYGLPVAFNLNEAYTLGEFYPRNDNTIELRYPADATNTFAQYFSITEFRTDEYQVYNAGFGKTNFTPLAVEATYNDFTSSSATLTASGEFDIFTVTFDGNDDAEDEWHIIGPAVTNQELLVPALPASITDELDFFSPSSLSLLSEVNFDNFGGLENYEDMLTKIQSSSDGIFEVAFADPRDLSLILNLGESSSGRKKSKNEPTAKKGLLYSKLRK